MRFLVVSVGVGLLLFSVLLPHVYAGAPASSAAHSLGRGVTLGQPLAGSSSALPLAFSPSTADLCPVITYSTSVEPIDPSDTLIPIQGKYASDAKANAPADATPMKIVFKPLTYVNNDTVPSVDWIDVHFRVESGDQQSLQMKAIPSSSHMKLSAAAASHALAHPADQSDSAQSMDQMQVNVGSSFEFGPVYLTKDDTLTYAFTVSASMIDCNTAVHTYKESNDTGTAALHQNPQSENDLNQQPLLSPPLVGHPRPQTESLQENAAEPSHAAATAATNCPAVSYTYKLDCGDSECKASFVNLSPDKPLDWVDLHLVRTDESQMRRLLSLSAAGPLHSSALTSAATDIQQNYQMKLAAGAVGQMKMKGSGAQTEHEESLLSSHEQTIKFGIASLPSTVLAESGGSQVFQLPIPLQFSAGDMVGMFFTYCASGTDCDSEIAFFKLEDDGTGAGSSPRPSPSRAEEELQLQLSEYQLAQARRGRAGRMQWSGAEHSMQNHHVEL